MESLFTQHDYTLCEIVIVNIVFTLLQTGIALPSKLSFSKMFSKFSLTTNDPDPMELQERIQGLESYLQVSTSTVQ